MRKTKKGSTGSGTEKQERKEQVLVKTEARHLPISPRKLRMVVQMIKGLSPREALRILPLVNKKGARFAYKAIKSAVANAKNNFGLPEEQLEFAEIVVNEGRRLKRRDRFHGARFSFGLIQKRRSHLRIVVKGSK